MMGSVTLPPLHSVPCVSLKGQSYLYLKSCDMHLTSTTEEYFDIFSPHYTRARFYITES